MSVIILLEADSAYLAHIIEDPNDYGENLIFASVEEADVWLQENARLGWCTRIIEL